MSPTERALWHRIQQRASRLSPEMARAMLQAFARLRASLSEAELARLIDSGAIDRLLAKVLEPPRMERAFVPVRDVLRRGIADAVPQFARDLPRSGRVDGSVVVSFDMLNPHVIDAVRQLDSRIMQTLREGIRDTVRAHVETGLRDGVAPRTIARSLKPMLGLAPNQEEAIRNFRRKLMGEGDPLENKLRDRRFDAAIRRGPLSAEQVQKMTDAYRRRMEAFNAETHARTATLDSLKLGQRLAWENGIEKGVVDPRLLLKTWVTVGDDRVRPEHVAMNGETVGFDDTFSNGQGVPGESDWNCRCIARYHLRRLQAA